MPVEGVQNEAQKLNVQLHYRKRLSFRHTDCLISELSQIFEKLTPHLQLPPMRWQVAVCVAAACVALLPSSCRCSMRAARHHRQQRIGMQGRDEIDEQLKVNMHC
jgi:hypothetical protein